MMDEAGRTNPLNQDSDGDGISGHALLLAPAHWLILMAMVVGRS
jgi:hypothetical protein